MTSTYLTRNQVAERYPISAHTLAKLASQGKGPRYFKPTDKCLYRPEDIEAWIEAAAVLPVTAEPSGPRITPPGGRGRAKPPLRATLTEASQRNGRKSLPPSINSWLRRTD
ncbi:helix-turn-helix transcriptional regulator [Devosia sp. A369]